MNPRPARRLALVLSLLSLVFGSGPAPAKAAPDGRQIYRKLCAECHGRSGEGVKGEYEEALHGDWSVEKLTRYIDRTMPEGNPGLCVGEDAAAVARFIHDTFYSREARARQTPPRVELVRLTNRQYATTLADLFKSFADPDARPGAERGLRASYRNRSKGPDAGKASFERLDTTIDFNFGKGSPFVDPNAPKSTNGVRTTNEFSLSWRGALLAPESGDYEFVVESPNGVRLWVNDEDQPLIDAGVASANLTEHRGRRRLLGGRAYPLRLEFQRAARDPEARIRLLWKPPHGSLQPLPSRHLAPINLGSTFVIATPFPADDSSVGYERGVMVSKEWDDATTQAAIEAARHVERHLDRLSRSRPGTADRNDQLRKFAAQFTEAAFRRPLTPEQRRVHVEAHFNPRTPPEESVKRVVLLALKSPRFLYLGLERAKPDDFEVASRLSYALWDSLPDRDLLRLAAEGSLRNPDTVNAQARRLLADPRARAKIRHFLHHWLQVNHVDDLSKDAELYPGFTPQVIADLRASLDLFLDDVVWGPGSDYRRLLLEDDFWVNQRLAGFYGVGQVETDEFRRVTLDPSQRSGVITHPYLLAAFAYSKSSSPIHRGVFLTRNIVGRALRPPPIATAFKDADFDPKLTMREKVAELTRPQACQSCHSVINPLGFSLEHFDAVGRFRTREGNRPIDAASDYTTDDGSVVKLKGARDVAEFAVGSEHAHRAFIEQLFHQLIKQPVLAYGSDTPAQLQAAFVQSGFNIQQLAINITTRAALHGVAPRPTPAARR
ncbi:MAG: hypothetical protein RJA22_1643 [Verrucomicrobiota bacterium]